MGNVRRHFVALALAGVLAGCGSDGDGDGDAQDMAPTTAAGTGGGVGAGQAGEGGSVGGAGTTGTAGQGADVEQGQLGQACYPNDTCDAGFTCVGSVCVEAPPDPECRTESVVNPVGSEKLNAAFCFSLAYEDRYTCTYNAIADVTYCDGTRTSYDVEWVGNDYGNVFDNSNDQFLGEIWQGPTGAFQIEWVEGAYGSCTVVGDVATLCVQAQ